MVQEQERVSRTPRGWELQTISVFSAVAAAAVLGMVLLVSDLALWAYLASDGAAGLSPMVRTVFTHAETFDLLYLLLVFGYIGGFTWWQFSTRQMLRRVGDTTGAATGTGRWEPGTGSSSSGS